jgi:hypothetical protein
MATRESVERAAAVHRERWKEVDAKLDKAAATITGWVYDAYGGAVPVDVPTMRAEIREALKEVAQAAVAIVDIEAIHDQRI